jgi:hypothetical protein
VLWRIVPEKAKFRVERGRVPGPSFMLVYGERELFAPSVCIEDPEIRCESPSHPDALKPLFY